jgi:hypothetical protein
MNIVHFFILSFLSLPYLGWSRGGHPVENIQYLDSTQFIFRISTLGQKAVVIISDGSCLWNPVPTTNCFLFEKQLDKYGTLIAEKGWKLYGVDVGFRNLDIIDLLKIRTRPTIKAFKNGQAIFTHDRLDNVYPNSPWQEELIVRILQEIN